MKETKGGTMFVNQGQAARNQTTHRHKNAQIHTDTKASMEAISRHLLDVIWDLILRNGALPGELYGGCRQKEGGEEGRGGEKGTKKVKMEEMSSSKNWHL